MTNRSSEIVKIAAPHSLTGGLRVAVRDDAGKDLPWHGPIVDGEEEQIQLAPGQSAESDQLALEYDHGNDVSCGNMEFLVGTYDAQVYLSGIDSNTVRFSVIPVPASEKKAYEALHTHHQSKLTRVELEAEIADYEKSIFLPNLMLEYWSRLHVLGTTEGERQTLQLSSRWYLTTFPDHPFCETAFHYYTDAVEEKLNPDRKTRITKALIAPYFERMSREVPGHFAAKLAEKELLKYPD
ncbi:MAG: hypothetical protein V1495_03620 [Pseudomonadota bacterium]